MIRPKRLIHALIPLFALAVVGCLNFSYQPPIIPVKLVVSSSGQVSIQTSDLSYATAIGTFAVGAEVPVANFDPNRDVVVILVDRNRGTEQVYRVIAGKDVHIVADGRMDIAVGADRRVTIDVTNGIVRTIEINGQRAQASSGGAGNPPPPTVIPTNLPPTRNPPTATRPPVPATTFEDHFGGTTLNSSIWTLDNFERNQVSVSGSQLHLASSGDRSPYIYSRSSPFPSSGDFRLTLRYGYSNVGVCGANISLTSGFLPPFIQGQSPAVFEPSTKVSFFIWHEVIWYDSQTGRQNILLPGGYTSPHEMAIEYRANRYRVVQDGTSTYTSDSTNARPRYIAFGNAAIQTNTCPWDSLDIDFVRVEQLP